MHPVCPPATMYYTLFSLPHTKNGLFGNWLLLVSGDKGIYSCVQNSSNLFHDKEDQWQNSTNTFFSYFQICFSFPNVTHVCLFFLSFLLGKRGGGGTSPQFNAGRVITDSVASADMIAIGGVWNRWRSLPRKNAAIFFSQRILSFFCGKSCSVLRGTKRWHFPPSTQKEKRTFFQFCSPSRRGQPRRTKKGQIGAPR